MPKLSDKGASRTTSASGRATAVLTLTCYMVLNRLQALKRVRRDRYVKTGGTAHGCNSRIGDTSYISRKHGGRGRIQPRRRDARLCGCELEEICRHEDRG